jgi:hypothetical protein
MSMNTTYNVWNDVVPSDTVDIATTPKLTDAVYVGEGGDLVAVAQNGRATTFVGVPTGMVLPVIIKRVNSTDTSAASIVALNAV